MKRFITFLCLCVMIATPAVSVSAQTDLREALVEERCSIIKDSLDKQRRRDLVSRINRGRAYQNIIDQMDALTTRVRNNSLSFSPFELQLNELKSSFDNFRASYTAYDDELSNLLAIDCVSQPQQFLTQLETVRDRRKQIGTSVLKIEDVFKRQREIITNLRVELEKIRNAVLGERG